jgi:DNA polymerase sigma
MFLKCFLYQHELDAPFTGGISSNTLMQMIVSTIHSAPEDIRLDARAILLSFLRCFGERFNYVVTGITTRNGGRLFSRLSEHCLNMQRPMSLCVEDPQSPGSFLGENAWQARVIHGKFKQAQLRLCRETVEYEQSIFGRVVQHRIVEELMAKRAEMQRHYAGPVGIEALPLDKKDEKPERQVTRGEVWVAPFARMRPNRPE